MPTRTVVRRSPIHGKGVFARARIRCGAYIGRYVGRRTTRNNRYVLWIDEPDGSVLGIEGRNSLRYVNHSARPNAEFRGDELFSIRSIRPGEEITVHYGSEWSDV